MSGGRLPLIHTEACMLFGKGLSVQFPDRPAPARHAGARISTRWPPHAPPRLDERASGNARVGIVVQSTPGTGPAVRTVRRVRTEPICPAAIKRLRHPGPNCIESRGTACVRIDCDAPVEGWPDAAGITSLAH